MNRTMQHSFKTNRFSSFVAGLFLWAAAFILVFFVILDVPSYNAPYLSIDENLSDSTPSSQEIVKLVDETAGNSSSIASTAQSLESSEAEGTSVPTGSILDASASVAKKKVSTIVPNSEIPVATVDLSPGWYIQVAAFESAVKAGVERLKFSKSQLPTRIEDGADGISRVLVGPYLSEAEAAEAQRKISKELKFKDGIIQSVNISELASSAVANQNTVSPSTQSAEIQKVPKPSSASSASTNAGTTKSAKSKSEDSKLENGWYVQVGAFKSRINARIERMKFDKLNFPTNIESGLDKFNRVLVGPYLSKSEADQTKTRISADLKVKDAVVRNIQS